MEKIHCKNNRACLLQAFSSIRLEQQEELTGRHFHEAVLQKIGDRTKKDLENLSNGDVKEAYKAFLEEVGIVLHHVTPNSPLPENIEGTTRYLVFKTEPRFVPFRNTGSDENLKFLLRRIWRQLRNMGFLSSFSDIYVTDDMEALHKALGAPHTEGVFESNGPISTCFAESNNKEPLALLMVEHRKAVSVPLHQCLMHEVSHVLIHYTWPLDEVYAHEDGKEILAIRLLAETCAHAIPAGILGHQYLFSSYLVSIAGASQDNSAPMEQLDASNDTEFFLSTFPWIASAHITNLKIPTLFSDIQDAWAPNLHSLAKDLFPIAQKAYQNGLLGHEDLSAAAHLLGSAGPCGMLFELYLARHEISLWETE